MDMLSQPHSHQVVDPPLVEGVDLDDTAACPITPACEGADCARTDDLAVATARTFGGVFCLTLCGSCADTAALPTLRPLDALSRCCRHAEHLGIDVDLMAELLGGGDDAA